jgi:hypothetical protein
MILAEAAHTDMEIGMMIQTIPALPHMVSNPDLGMTTLPTIRMVMIPPIETTTFGPIFIKERCT